MRLIALAGRFMPKRIYPIQVEIIKPRGGFGLSKSALSNIESKNWMEIKGEDMEKITKEFAGMKLERVKDRGRKVKFIEGGRRKKLKSWQMHLLYDNKDTFLPLNADVMIDNKGKQIITLLNPRPGLYLPLSPRLDLDNMELVYAIKAHGRLGHFLTEVKKNINDINISKDFWEKYGPVIMVGTIGMIMIVFALFYAQGLEKQMGLMNQISAALERVVEKLGNVAPI